METRECPKLDFKNTENLTQTKKLPEIRRKSEKNTHKSHNNTQKRKWKPKKIPEICNKNENI